MLRHPRTPPPAADGRLDLVAGSNGSAAEVDASGTRARRVARGDGAADTRGVKPLAVHHVSVNVTNADESVAFYTDVLGGRVRDDRPDFGFGGAWIDLGSTQVHLIEAGVPANLGQHFAILVGDIDEAVDELRTKGITVADPVVVGADRQTFIEDPSGNGIEIHQIGIAGA